MNKKENGQVYEKNKVIVAAVSVLVLIIVVAGVTASYWSWRSADTQKTNVNFSVVGGNEDLSASIDGSGTVNVVGLLPGTCQGPNALNKKVTITYKNLTVSQAKVTARLNLVKMTPTHTGAKSFPDRTDLSHLHISLTNSASECGTGTFADVTSNNFPKEMIVKEISVPKNTAEKTDTFYLHIWLDEDYTYENEGNEVQDVMQDLKLQLSWSGTIAQVEG